jgi:hypothetical protein
MIEVTESLVVQKREWSGRGCSAGGRVEDGGIEA